VGCFSPFVVYNRWDNVQPFPCTFPHSPVLVVVGVCPASTSFSHSSSVFLYCVLCSNLAALPSLPWRGPYSLHDLDSVTVAQAMALRPMQRILRQEPEFRSTAMPVDSPPRTQPAPSPSRSLIQQIERRRADGEASQAHRETPQRVSQSEKHHHNEITPVCQQLQAVATFQTQRAQVTCETLLFQKIVIVQSLVLDLIPLCRSYLCKMNRITFLQFYRTLM